MKMHWLSVLGLALLGLAGWTGLDDPVALSGQPLEVEEPLKICGSWETPLVTKKHDEVGVVRISHDGDTLYIAIEADGWLITESHVQVADHLDGIPQTRKGNPKVGRFDYSRDHHDPVAADVYAISLADHGWNASWDACGDEDLVIAAHAVVVREKKKRHRRGDSDSDSDSHSDSDSDSDSDRHKDWHRKSAWASGEPFPGRSWAMYVDYDLRCCCDAYCESLAHWSEAVCQEWQPDGPVCADLNTFVEEACPTSVCEEEGVPLLDACLHTGWFSCFESIGDPGFCQDFGFAFGVQCALTFLTDPYEPNDDPESAFPIGVPVSGEACVDHGEDVDYFAIDVPVDARLSVYVESLDYRFPMTVELFADPAPGGEPIATGDPFIYLEVPAGMYWLRVSSASGPMCYWINLYGEPLPIEESEPNDGFDEANEILFFADRASPFGCIEPPGDVDVYTFEVTEPVELRLFGGAGFWPLYGGLYDDATPEPNLLASLTPMGLQAVLLPGVYYLVVESDGFASGCYWGDIELMPLPDDPFEPNDELSTPHEVEVPVEGTACLVPHEDADVFAFTVEPDVVLDIRTWSWHGVPVFVELFAAGDEPALVLSGHDGLSAFGLPAGEYLARFTADGLTCYGFDISSQPIPDDPYEGPEGNDTSETAWEIPWLPYYGELACINPASDIDYYRLEVPFLADVSVRTWAQLGVGPVLVSLLTADTGEEIAAGADQLEAWGVEPGAYLVRISSDTPLCYGFFVEAYPATNREVEPNDTPADASDLGVLEPWGDISAEGCIEPETDVDYWRFELTDAAVVFIEGFGNMELYDEDGAIVADGEWGISAFVTAGAYHLRVAADWSSCYWLWLRAEPLPEDPYEGSEGNDTPETATPIDLPWWGFEPACIYPDTDVDYYAFDVPFLADVTVNAQPTLGSGPVFVAILDATTGEVLEDGEDWVGAYGVEPGDYLLRASSDSVACYPLFVDAVPAAIREVEPNDTPEDATFVGSFEPSAYVNTEGCIDPETDVDWWAFELTGDSFLGIMGFGSLELYDETGELVAAGFWSVHAFAPAGAYTLRVSADWSECYQLSFQLDAVPDDPYESNDTPETATPIEVPRYGGADACIHPADDVDHYAFEIPGAAEVVVGTMRTYGDGPVFLDVMDQATGEVLISGADWLQGEVDAGEYLLRAWAESPLCYGFFVDVSAQPLENPATIEFVVDDSANQTYTEGQLQWKGPFDSYIDEETGRLVMILGSWDPPHIPLFDDGPISAGGHEPEGQTANDNNWSVQVDFYADPMSDTEIQYGLVDENDGWIWRGENGSVVVPAGSEDHFVAPGMTIPAFGDYDFRLVLEPAELDPDFLVNFPGPPSLFEVKGDFAGWQLFLMEPSSDGTLEFVWSEHLELAPHGGLLNLDDEVQWVFVIDGLEYKQMDDGGYPPGWALTDGVTAFTLDTAADPPADWVSETIFHVEHDGWANTAFEVGEVLEVEPNDTQDEATWVGLVEAEVIHEVGGCIDPPGDVDFWSFELALEMFVDIETFDVFEVYDAQAELVVTSEWETWEGLLAPGFYFIRLTAEESQCYPLSVRGEARPDDPWEDNDTEDTATPIWVPYEAEELACVYPVDDVDYYAFDVNSTTAIVAGAWVGIGQEPIFLEVLDADTGETLASSADELFAPRMEPGSYLLRVWSDAPLCYTLYAETYPAANNPAIIEVVVVDGTGTYEPGQLRWRGSFVYDPDTNTISHDWDWSGPYIPLHDDGPFSEGGHEAEGQQADDHVWSTEVMFWAHPTEETGITHNLIDESGARVWGSSTGDVIIPPGAEDRFLADLTIPAFGDYDFRLVLDANNLNQDFVDWLGSLPTSFEARGNFDRWNEHFPLESVGGGLYELVWSNNLPPHRGLLNPGDEVKWLFVLDGVEYKDKEGWALPEDWALMEGVTAFTRNDPVGEWVAEVLYHTPPNRFGSNTAFIVGPD